MMKKNDPTPHRAYMMKGGILFVRLGLRLRNLAFLIYETHVGPIKRGRQIVFKDGDVKNYDVDNLRVHLPLRYRKVIATMPDGTTTTFKSAKHAASECNVYEGHILACLRGKMAETGGIKFARGSTSAKETMAVV